jgi:hypothetical protein
VYGGRVFWQARRHIVEVAVGVRRDVVDRGRRDARLDRLADDGSLHAARGAWVVKRSGIRDGGQAPERRHRGLASPRHPRGGGSALGPAGKPE